MTTPERLRRRQRVEGVMIMVIGGLMLFQGWYNETRDDKQDAADRDQQVCLAKNFKELSEALNVRSDLTTRESEAVEQVILGVARDPANSEQLAQVFDDFESEMADINQIRKENPLPPYPPGTCEREK